LPKWLVDFILGVEAGKSDIAEHSRAALREWRRRRNGRLELARLDERIFEPLRGEFELPIERLRWEQPVERAGYRLQRSWASGRYG
jgi:hypothetical protein